MRAMPSVDLVDETFVVVNRERIAAIVADPKRWQMWWPSLSLTVFMDRGIDGVRWSVTGSLVGSSEIWLEPMSDGVLVHYYLRADPTRPGSDIEARVLPDSGRGRREIDRLRRRHATSWKAAVWSLKDELEDQRTVGTPGPR